MTTQGEGSNVSYEGFSSNQQAPQPAYNPEFVSVSSPQGYSSQQNQPSYIMPSSQQPQQQQYPSHSSPYSSQPHIVYVPQHQPQPQHHQQQQPLYQPQSNPPPQPIVSHGVDRHTAIHAKLHGRHCCFFFSYPVGVKIVSAFQILSWFIFAISYTAAHMWWLWIFAVLSIVLCYYGYTGAHRFDEKRLRWYLFYLITMLLVYLILMFVSISMGDGGFVAWLLTFLLVAYWTNIVRDFVRVIHEVDYGIPSHDRYHHDDHHHDHHGHH